MSERTTGFPFRLGLIGYGGFGRFCLEAYSRMPELRVVAVADIDPQRREEAHRRLGVRTHADPLALIGDPEVDVVAIVTPPHTHADLAIAAARAGKHIFCDKPLAIRLADAERVLETVRACGVRLSVNYVQRYNPLNQQVWALLRAGTLGPLFHLSLENCASDEALKPGHWFWDPEQSGGIWVEHGVHFFDLFAWWADSLPDEITAFHATRPDGCTDRVWAQVRYPSGAVAHYYHGFTQPARFERTEMRLVCGRGYVVLNGWIPTRMSVDAIVDKKGLCRLQDWAGPNVQNWALVHYSPEQQEGWASGKPYRATVRVCLSVELEEGKSTVYQKCIQEGMRDLLRTIEDPYHIPKVTAEDGYRSLETAVHATRASVPIPSVEAKEGK